MLRIEHLASGQPSPVPTLLLLLQVKEPVPLTIHHIPLAVTLALFQVAALGWFLIAPGTGGCR